VVVPAVAEAAPHSDLSAVVTEVRGETRGLRGIVRGTRRALTGLTVRPSLKERARTDGEIAAALPSVTRGTRTDSRAGSKP